VRIGGFHVNKFCLVLLVLFFGFGITFSGCGTTDISDVVGTDYFNLSGVVLDNDDEGIEGVTIKFTGDFGSKETETDEDGAWEKEDLEGVVTVTPEKDGLIFDPENKVVDEESILLFTAAEEEIKIEINPSDINFGDVDGNEEKTEEITILNSADSNNNLTGSLALSGSDNFSIADGDEAFDLPPGESHNAGIIFSPDAPKGLKVGIVEISHNATNVDSSIEVEVQGVSIYNFIQITPSSVQFGKVDAGDTDNKNIIIENLFTSSDDISGNVNIEGSSDFSVTNNEGPFSLSPGQQIRVEIEFSPSELGLKEAKLIINHDASNEKSPIVLPVGGEGVPIVIDEDASKDAYVDLNKPDEEFGDSEFLLLEMINHFPYKDIYMSFEGLEAIPESATILEAYIQLDVIDTSYTPFDIKLGYITSYWAESTITGKNKPSSTFLEGVGYTVEESLEGSIWQIPITNELQDIVNILSDIEPNLHGFLFQIVSSINCQVYFASRHHETRAAPRLYVEYVPFKIDP